MACGASDSESGPGSQSGAWDTESPDDETKSTHLWVVNRGMDILAKHTDLPNAENTLAWLKDQTCQVQWHAGLLQADFLAPFNGAGTDLTVPTGAEQTDVEAAEGNFEVAASHASWMSHFYDPGTGKNYLGFANSSELPDDPIAHPAYAAIKAQVEVNGPIPVEAKGSAIYRVGRVVKLLGGTNVKSDHKNEPKDARSRGCYELGLALHYFTDITQPMHAANYAATDRPRLLHSNWEGWAETKQANFVRGDWSAPPSGDLDAVIQAEAVKSHARFGTADDPGPLFKSILDAYSAGSSWDASGKAVSDTACKAAALELSTAGFVSVDMQKCWANNPTVLKETGAALGDAQEMTARFLATLELPKHAD
jgi:phospholipase C